MHFSLKFIFLLCLSLLSSYVTAVGPLQERSGCNGDNLLRNLRDRKYSSSASTFCSEWLQSAATTLAATATLSITVTSTPGAGTIIQARTTTITGVDTIITTVFPTAINTFVKRVEIPYPPWLTSTYPPARVSSACSCFIVPPTGGLLTVTATAATRTTTRTEVLLSITATQTSLVTQTASATTTSVIEGGPVPCGVIGCTDSDGFYDQLQGSNLVGCRTFCQNTPSCQSFQFGSLGSDTVCNIFDTNVADAYANGFSSDINCQQFRFYDLRCLI
ncbi:hypothetical protein TWF225_004258 [Orbilia oligospora]|nr:hypothetical protein TWF225_004258 [Orbilia oligospora]KAF3245116.1 hypothetical protein TWF128_009512 [Orbilia oligospora]KAF3272852.1 hypothetical protein TWF217_000312 [Orbilia oligospora]